MKSLPMILLFAFVMCLALAMVVPSASAAPAEQTPQELCNCIQPRQQQIYIRDLLQTCKEVRGADCGGVELRIIKPWTYNAARNACIGTYEVWETYKGTPYRATSGTNVEVDMDTARKRCEEIGITFATTAAPTKVPPSATTVPPTKAPPSPTTVPPTKIPATPTLTLRPATTVAPTFTSTGVAVVAKYITLDPMVRTFIAASPTLDQAIKSILNQDSALIARDEKNNFYAINNQGKSIPLPAALGAMIKFSHNFAVLNNEQLLASSEHSSIRGTINGGGDFVMLNKIPPEMKDKAYVAFATTCSLTKASVPLAALASNFLSQEIDQCRPEMRVNSTASSFKVAGAALGSEYQEAKSSEHASIRGTINGTGDFIFDPPMIKLASYTQQTQKPFVGVQYELNDRGALVKLVVSNSPADKAGLKIGDVIQKADGQTINAQQTLAAIIRSRAVGDSIPLVVSRSNQTLNLNLRVGALGAPIIYTPSATIYPNDATLAIDIGFNGFTGVYVINGKARVGDVDLESGDAVIVAPMNKVSKPIKLNAGDVNQWWDTTQPQTTVAPTLAATPDRTPTPDTDLTTAITNALIAGGLVLLCGFGLFGAGAVFWMMRRS